MTVLSTGVFHNAGSTAFKSTQDDYTFFLDLCGIAVCSERRSYYLRGSDSKHNNLRCRLVVAFDHSFCVGRVCWSRGRSGSLCVSVLSTLHFYRPVGYPLNVQKRELMFTVQQNNNSLGSSDCVHIEWGLSLSVFALAYSLSSNWSFDEVSLSPC